MSFERLAKDMNIIAQLDDEPNDVGGLTSAELKAKFDEGGNAVKDAFNGLIDALEAGAGAASLGAKDADGNDSTVQDELDTIRGCKLAEYGVTTQQQIYEWSDAGFDVLCRYQGIIYRCTAAPSSGSANTEFHASRLIGGSKLVLLHGRMRGDVNGNGEIDSDIVPYAEGGRSDLQIVMAAAADKYVLSGSEKWCADVDQDGSVTATDAIFISERARGIYNAYVNADYYGNWTWRDATHDWACFVPFAPTVSAIYGLPSGYTYAQDTGGFYVYAPNPPIVDVNILVVPENGSTPDSALWVGQLSVSANNEWSNREWVKI